MFLDAKRKNEKFDFNNFKINYGFLNIRDNKSVYVNITSWVVLNDVNTNLKRNELIKSIKKHLFNNINTNLITNDKYIVDLTYRKAGLKLNTKCYFELEIILYPPTKYFNQCKELNNELLKITKSLIEDVITPTECVTFHIKK